MPTADGPIAKLSLVYLLCFTRTVQSANWRAVKEEEVRLLQGNT